MQEGFPPAEIATNLGTDGSGVIVTVSGEIDMANSPDLLAEIRRHLVEGRPTTVDMAAVTFLDASGVAVLVAAYKEASDLAVPLAIVNADHRSVTRVLTVTGVDRFLPLRSPD